MPEEIINHFPALNLDDVYAIIAFYLINRVTVKQYLQEQEEKAFEVWQKIEAIPGYYGVSDTAIRTVPGFGRSQKGG